MPIDEKYIGCSISKPWPVFNRPNPVHFRGIVVDSRLRAGGTGGLATPQSTTTASRRQPPAAYGEHLEWAVRWVTPEGSIDWAPGAESWLSTRDIQQYRLPNVPMVTPTAGPRDAVREDG